MTKGTNHKKGGINMTNKIINDYTELTELVKNLSEDDKREALALLKGMLIGKELSKQQNTKTA